MVIEDERELLGEMMEGFVFENPVFMEVGDSGKEGVYKLQSTAAGSMLLRPFYAEHHR